MVELKCDISVHVFSRCLKMAIARNTTTLSKVYST